MLDSKMFLKNLRSAWRGASGGLSGMTTEHLRPILDNSRDSELLFLQAQEFAQAIAPWEVVRVVGMGRLTALQKLSGGVRGIVSGEVFRRLVARTIAQQLAPALEKAAPFQYAFSTKSGCECVAHAIQALTDFDPDTTLLSIDGIGAFDLISRNAMLQGLANVEGGGRAVPFVSQFYASFSTYIWEDEFGETFEILQGEGGEQGDPLMPALFSVGQHPAFVEVQNSLKLGERMFAFLDDIYVVCPSSRVAPIFKTLTAALWTHVRIQVHFGKNTILEQERRVLRTMRRDCGDSEVSRPHLHRLERGPFSPNPAAGRHQCWEFQWGILSTFRQKLRDIGESPITLFERIPAIPDLQCAWLVLLFCAATRANFLLHSPPDSRR